MNSKCLISSVIILCIIVNAKIIYAEKKGAFPKPEINVYVGMEQFPNKYNGDNVENIVTALRKIDKEKLEKDKFETKAQYEKRLENIVPNSGDIYAFKLQGWLNTGSVEEMQLIYNADKEALLIKVGNFVDYVVKEASYKNAYGKEKKIKFLLESKESYMPEDHNREMKCEWGDCKISIPIKPEIAKANRDNIKLIAICNIVSLFDDGTGPYYNDGSDKITINIKFIGLWIYNDKTGEIYTKF